MATKKMQVNLPEDEANYWETKAKNAGLSASSWIARMVRMALDAEAHEKIQHRLMVHDTAIQRHEERITRLEARITRVEDGEVNSK